MTQTTDQVSSGCGMVEISTDNASWTDISGVANTVTDNEQNKIHGEAYTLEGDGALIGAGKKEPLEVNVQIVYTENDAEGYEILREHWDQEGCDNPIWLRFSPQGGDAGDELLTSGEGRMISFTFPQLDAADGNPIMSGCKIKVPGFTTTIIAS